MNPGSRIRELVQCHLADDHHVRPVDFIDQLLQLAGEVGCIRCTLANDNELRFETSDQKVQFELGRAKSIIRMLCARLAKLRQESGQQFELYGGEGWITRQAAESSQASYVAWLNEQGVTRNGPSRSTFTLDRWKVNYKNTMGQQEFTIVAE